MYIIVCLCSFWNSLRIITVSLEFFCKKESCYQFLLPQSIIITITVLGGVLVLILNVIACSIVISCMLHNKMNC